LLLCSGFLWGCYLHAASSQKPGVLSYKIIEQGNWSAYGSRLRISSPSYQIFADRTNWASYWAKEYKRQLPEVDFKKHFVIYITLGQQKTGGYSLSIASVVQRANQLNDKNIVIFLEIEEPGPGQGVDLGETNPYLIAQIESPIFFNKKPKSSRWNIRFVRQINGQHLPVEMIVMPPEIPKE